MKTIRPYRTGVTSFSSSASSSTQAEQGFEYDSGDYILSIASPPPSQSQSHASPSSGCSIIAAALSNRSIALYDTNTGRVIHRIEKVHDGPISAISFFPWEYHGCSKAAPTATSLPLLCSASHDGSIKLWDARSINNINNQQQQSQSQQPALTMKLALPNEQALSLSIGYGGTLIAVGTNKARISFFDMRYASSLSGKFHMPSGTLMGSYVDAHTEEVTRVHFQSIPVPSQQPSLPQQYKTILATSSEDGLITIHDPSQPSEDAALLSVLNIGTPLRTVGFFGPNYEGLYALTGSETMSVHHWDSAQRVSDVGGAGLRGLLSNAVNAIAGNAVAMNNDDGGSAVEYLVGCTWAPVSTTTEAAATPALHLLAGNSNGDAYLFRMDADKITPVAELKGGHRGCIRDFCWVGSRMITGGEDARLCDWDLTGNAPPILTSGGSGGSSFGSGKSKTTARSQSKTKGKKKFGSPY